jgi:hypothetical protein
LYRAVMVNAGSVMLLVRKTSTFPVCGSLNLMRRKCSIKQLLFCKFRFQF